MSNFSCVVIGNESLLIQCSEILLQRGHSLTAVVTRNEDVKAWAVAKGLRTEAPGAGLADRLGGLAFDWLFSIANLSLIPEGVLAQARRGAVNFHDGPLPRHAGLNAPVWALLEQERQHGVTWHMIEGGIDEGDILAQRIFDISPAETALTLNTRCYEAAIESFAALVPTLEAGEAPRRAQDLSERTFHARADRPAAAARLDFAQSADRVVSLVRALDHGSYRNPMACAKIELGEEVVLVGTAEPAEGLGLPGTVLGVSEAGLRVATATGAVLLGQLCRTDGTPLAPNNLATVGDVLPALDAAKARHLTEAIAAVAPGEGYWRTCLGTQSPAELPQARQSAEVADWQSLPVSVGLSPARLPAAIALLTLRLGGESAFDLALRDAAAPKARGYLSDWVPLRLSLAGLTVSEAEGAVARVLGKARRYPAYALDLIAREPGLTAPETPQIALSMGEDAPVEGSVVTLVLTEGAALHYDAARLPADQARALIARLEVLAAAMVADADAPADRLPVLPEEERALVIEGWNATETAYDRDTCIHQLFEAQAARTPEATALVFEGETLSYAALNAAANRAAHVLREMGVGPGVLVALATRRSVSLLVGALAILKAGGAYVPLDPGYPAERTAYCLKDSEAAVIVTQADLVAGLPAHGAAVLAIDSDPRIGQAAAENVESGVAASDLAYLIYTSGSTGQPKGVMVEHRNVANFFAGMDDRIRHEPPGVWLAVTSLSFDISVLELFYTLARGFKLVLTSDEDRALISGGSLPTGRAMDFSLYYWGNDDGAGPKKYELLLEGAKFADAHGFAAVWTPERHFHAFGGPYPNPSVTGAAVAAVTRNIGVRAGSCVAPLHHPARIAEEWAVIDNLTNGRAGLAIASGWQPDDFVLRPQNTPPQNKPAMFEAIEQVRKLWRGEAVEFPTASGEPFAVVTQPRPVSKELPIWVTTAGNPETWREAGSVGANVLTHLLGQSVAEVAEKIVLYKNALRDAGHNPDDFTVTLMLHSFLAEDREEARRIAREPMKDYLRSAAGLIKQYAWAFPAFKKPEGVKNPFELDLRSLNEDEMEGILDFAFQRYFEDSGLFGTVEDCVARVEELRAIGVTEIACLIDYGIPTETVLEGLKPLAEVLRRTAKPRELAEDDYSIAAQIVRHDVTHLQCTPSMARMIAMNDEGRVALGRVQNLMLGGEALPGAQVADLQKITGARIENMYGPTETTIWSSTGAAEAGAGVASIGRPIANTRLYVLDAAMNPLPVGVPGELFIGGDGVTRGYWRRDDLTAERFLPDPFVEGGRIYRTGDLARWRSDGAVDFLGRTDHQVKLRGYRIELGEIESCLETHAGVRQAVVMAREDSPGDLRLVAYLTLDRALPDGALRDHVTTHLPPHMVPAHFVTLASFPLTPNRKVDRKALPAPQAVAVTVAPDQVFEAPGNDVERQIAEVWSRVLGVPRVSAGDNFFALGGHSLLAVQAHREIRLALGTTKLSITDIFRFPTLAALAAHLGAGTETGKEAEIAAPVLAERAIARADAMSRRRALRAGRGA